MIDPTLNPPILSFRNQINKLLMEFDQDFKNKTFSKTFHSYFQEHAKNSSEILLPTQPALTFYKTLSNKKTLREKLAKFYISKKLISLQLENNFDRAKQLLDKYRSCQLVKLMKPGALSAFLEKRDLLSNKVVVSKDKKRQVKKVRFA